ncbi:hypothetical protein HJG60_008593 [Phyllostomus discolor]|uniref:Uncharacterized protein n=1 Tax=Phyllostomus discolor TaxID=89673 RepID=A0A833Z1K1_9CHIR|nr:hypothetical protein HJG60_008593 [Phyllostomus discolor]
MNVGLHNLPAALWAMPLHSPPPCWACLPPPCSPRVCHLPYCNPSLPGHPTLPLLPVWMNVSSLTPWLLDSHTVQFSVSSGCFLFLNCCCSYFGSARRHSVSAYTSILAGSPLSNLLILLIIHFHKIDFWIHGFDKKALFGYL